MSIDTELIEQCKAGSLEAFGKLVKRYEGRLFAMMCNILYNAEDARDVLQDTFLLAYESLGKFEGRSDFYTWLHRIGVNAAITYKRKRPTVASLDPDHYGKHWEPPDKSHGCEPSHTIIRAEESKILSKALSRLPARDRALLVLKDIDGLRYEELAVRLELPLGTVRSRLHRARMKLLRMLKSRR